MQSPCLVCSLQCFFFNPRHSLSIVSKDTEAFIINFSSAFSCGGESRKLSALKALMALFYYGVAGDKFALQASSLVPKSFPREALLSPLRCIFLHRISSVRVGLLFSCGSLSFCPPSLSNWLSEESLLSF